MIKNILKNEIKLRLHKKIKKYTSLKEKLEKVIDGYHTNALYSYATIVSLTKLNEILQEIMQQAEGQFSDWSA